MCISEEKRDQHGWREGKEESMEVLGERERSQEARAKILDFILYVVRWHGASDGGPPNSSPPHLHTLLLQARGGAASHSLVPGWPWESRIRWCDIQGLFNSRPHEERLVLFPSPLSTGSTLSQNPAVTLHGEATWRTQVGSHNRSADSTDCQLREGATLDAPHHQSLHMIPLVARGRRITRPSTANCQNHGRQKPSITLIYGTRRVICYISTDN